MPFIDIRAHGGVFGGKGARVKFVKVTYSLTEPTNPEEDEIWIKHEGSVNNLYFDEVQPPLMENDLFIKVVNKEQIAKATQIKQSNKILPVTSETPTFNKNKIVETDYFDVYGFMGIVRIYKNGQTEILDAYQWKEGAWKIISLKNYYLFGGTTNEEQQKITLDGEVIAESNYLANNPIRFVSANPVLNELAFIDSGNKIVVLDLETFAFKRSFNYGNTLIGLDYTQDGIIATANSTSSTHTVILDSTGTKIAQHSHYNSTINYYNVAYDREKSNLFFVGSNFPRVWNIDEQTVAYYGGISGGNRSSHVAMSSDDTVVYSYHTGYLYGRFSYTHDPSLILVHSVSMPSEVSNCLGIVSDYTGEVYALAYKNDTGKPLFVYKYDKYGNQVKLFNISTLVDTSSFTFDFSSNLTMRLTPAHLIFFIANPLKLFVLDRNTLDVVTIYNAPYANVGSYYPSHHNYDYLW